mgnify:CR=1 FL=1
MPFINDFVVKENLCNMRCKYCLTQTSTFVEEIFKSNCLVYEKNSKLKDNMDKVTEEINREFNISILKISGGEILMVEGILDYIKKHASKYKKVQLLTNGMLLSPMFLTELKKIENVCIQISIDHHTIEGNGYRTSKYAHLKKILDNLDYAVQLGFEIEINCVLHNKNTHLLLNYVQYLSKYAPNILLLPFPIRGQYKDNFYPQKEQLQGVEEVINQYDLYKEILPPKIYLEYLLRFLNSGKREIPCVLPQVAIGSFDDGRITPCANYWFTSLGNIMVENSKKVFNKVNTHSIYRALSSERCRPNECNQCFTPWEIINLYCLGKLSVEDLKKIPLYSFQGLEECLSNVHIEERKT